MNCRVPGDTDVSGHRLRSNWTFDVSGIQSILFAFFLLLLCVELWRRFIAEKKCFIDIDSVARQDILDW